jgi:Leucine-rich repeat (LRR) protein
VVGFNDAQASYLSPLANLRHLDLSGNYVTDEGLLHLRELKRLEHLEISNNPITDTGVGALCEALPGLNVLDD